jgi:large subunit ribosomal protein L10
VAAAKVAREYSDENEKLKIIGGSMGSEILDASGVDAVSKMPSRDELISSIIAAIISPASNLAATLGGPGASLSGSIAGIEDQKAA